MSIIFLSGSTNPDSSSIANKEQIDISLSVVDISASMQSIKTNYSATIPVVTVGEGAEEGNIYYTPIYKEKLNYETWLNRINKNFQELD